VYGSADAALGQRLGFGAKEARKYEIVGVVADARTLAVRRLPAPAVYRPVAQATGYLSSLEVRAMGDPALLAESIRRTVRAAHPGLPAPSVTTLEQHRELSLGQDRLVAVLANAFGLAALFLVCVGLYGVITHWAAQRTREIGLRMALGAPAGGVRWLVLRQALGLVVAGMAVGVPASLASARLLQGLLFGVMPGDPVMLAAPAVAMLGVTLAAAYLPARRASRVDPMIALRAE
jgi:predicted lysophospholipase L1 biosynthesis ABC-type transport system permease subunit